jgi:chemotaxis protein methyltransferase CheR
VIAHDGYLMLGAAETVVGLTESFKPIPDKRGLYAPHPVSPKTDSKVINFAATRAAIAGAGR